VQDQDIKGQAAKQDPTAVRHRLAEAGFSPIPLFGKKPAINDWPRYDDNTSNHEIDFWGRTIPAAINTGILTRTTPGFDIDIFDAAAAQTIEDLARERFGGRGTILVRTGKAPKRCIMFRTDTPFSKMKRVFGEGHVPDKDCEKLEFLCDGQQVVVDGIHPDTGQPYTWAGGALDEVGYANLPLISAEEAKALFDDAVKLLLEKFGRRLWRAGKTKANGTGGKKNYSHFWRSKDCDYPCTPTGVEWRDDNDGRIYARVAAPDGAESIVPKDELVPAHAGHADWQRLLDNIREGLSLHDSLRDLAAKMVTAGTHKGAVVNHLRALMEGSAAPRDERWKERYAEIPRLVESAETKFGAAEATATSLPVSDFVAFSPDHTYIHRATGEPWTPAAVNARVLPVGSLAANKWLDRHDAVEQRIWAPGESEIIENRMVAEGGFFAKPGARIFNLYKPPMVVVAADQDIKFWRDHLYTLWPRQADHIEKWFAFKTQQPGDKINHGLLLGGDPGIGKDAVIEALKRAVGSWNFKEISPQAVLGTFNEFARTVVLRISEAKDLGDFDRFSFYEATKTLMAAPPDTLRINEKYGKPYHALNVVGVIITTNHKVSGLFLPADDRRHFVAWSVREQAQFDADYWAKYWGRMESGGATAVAAHLRSLDLTKFNPKAPPERTQAFWEMVNAMRSEDESDMADAVESLGYPKALTVSCIVARARRLDCYDLMRFLQERKNARLVALRLESCGCRRLANPHDKRGRWQIGEQRTGVYVRKELTDREGFDEVKALIEL
jgi:hypothetical protein